LSGPITRPASSAQALGPGEARFAAVVPDWLKVVSGCLALMIGASAPPLAIEYLRPEPRPQYVARGLGGPQQKSADLQQRASAERGTEQVPLIVKVLPSESTPEAEAREKEKEKHERRLADYTEGLFFATLFLGAATVALAIAAFLQMREGRRAITAAEDAANAAAASAMHLETSTAQAARSADAMEEVAQSMTANVINTRQLIDRQRDFAQRQMRAYVSVYPGNIIPQHGTVRFEGATFCPERWLYARA
jgi:hypothetical protein